MSPLDIPTLDVSDHVRTILTTIVTLAGHRAYQGIDRWLHTVGYRGHITTKSRLFSTTMGALRAHRATWIREQQTELFTHWQSGRSQVQLAESLGIDRNTIALRRPVIRSVVLVAAWAAA